MIATLKFTLETALHRAIQEKQYYAIASNPKVLLKFIGLEAKIKISLDLYLKYSSFIKTEFYIMLSS